MYHPCSQLVYAASSHQVRHVWIRGRQVLRNGEPLTLDPAVILTAAREWAGRISED
jgi:5-methylthioadenosine/S-adenosylhomocysteine deaminase